MANTFKVDKYKSAEALSYISIGIFVFLIFINVLQVIFGTINIISPNWQMRIEEDGVLSFVILLVSILEASEIFVLLFAIVFFLIWLYRSFSNLSPLKARDLEFSPGWAVGWWFIPIANLFKPYQAVKELWRESDPEFDENLGFLSSVVDYPAFFGIWWACWIISNILSNISARISDAISRSTSTDEATITVFFTVFVASSIFIIIAGGILIYIIRDTTMRQEKRFERIGDSKTDLPPEPPIFNE